MDHGSRDYMIDCFRSVGLLREQTSQCVCVALHVLHVTCDMCLVSQASQALTRIRIT